MKSQNCNLYHDLPSPLVICCTASVRGCLGSTEQIDDNNESVYRNGKLFEMAFNFTKQQWLKLCWGYWKVLLLLSGTWLRLEGLTIRLLVMALTTLPVISVHGRFGMFNESEGMNSGVRVRFWLPAENGGDSE